MLKKLGLSCLVLMTTAAVASAITALPDFNTATFNPGAPIDNTYFPLAPGTVYTYEADLVDPDTLETESIKIEEFVTFDTKVVSGVTARQVRAREWIDDLLVEDTFDWYAQDTHRNVWYLGEFSTAFEYDDSDQLVGTNHDGSWEAGVNGALPGYIMPGNPQIGFNYFQEHAAADSALDEATITSLTEAVSIDFGDFSNVLATLETTQLEPGVYENKLYAPNIGLVLIEEDVDEFGNNPENVIPLVDVQVVPEPVGVMLLSVSAMMMIFAGRRGRIAAS